MPQLPNQRSLDSSLGGRRWILTFAPSPQPPLSEPASPVLPLAPHSALRCQLIPPWDDQWHNALIQCWQVHKCSPQFWLAVWQEKKAGTLIWSSKSKPLWRLWSLGRWFSSPLILMPSLLYPQQPFKFNLRTCLNFGWASALQPFLCESIHVNMPAIRLFPSC